VKFSKEDWKQLDKTFENFQGVCQSEGFDLTEDEYELWDKVKRMIKEASQ
jgi:hypothetical protein